jgi:ABC-type branched-subunit amino acid transport system substrate-binding protein
MKITRRLLPRTLIILALGVHAACVHAEGGVSKSSIAIGQSVALTGPGAALAVPFHQGARLYFDKVNGAGGIHGRRIDLVTLDDHGDPAQALANTRKLLEQGMFALFGFYGSPQVTAAYPAIKDTDVLLFAPMAAADELRGALFGNVYSIRPGYSEEAAAITRHAETLGAKRLFILHAADGESLAALDAATRTMTGLGANLVGAAAVARASDDSGPVLAMKQRAESVLVIGSATEAAAMVRTVRAKGFRGPIYGFSNTGESVLADQLGPAGAGMVVVRVVPRSDAIKLPVVRELVKEAKAAGLDKPNVYMLEGYLAAGAFCEALRRLPKDFTRAKLRKAIAAMGELDLGGFRVLFDDERVGSKMVELSLIDSTGKVRE